MPLGSSNLQVTISTGVIDMSLHQLWLISFHALICSVMFSRTFEISKDFLISISMLLKITETRFDSEPFCYF